MKYFARSLDGAKPPRRQLLSEHLLGVAEYSRGFAISARPTDSAFANAAYLVGLLHDLGKYRDEFQDYLLNGRQSSVETAHSVYGAAAACLRFDFDSAAFAVAGHHSGLHDADKLQLLIEGTKFRAGQRLAEIFRRAEAVNELGNVQVAGLPNDFDDTEQGQRRYEFLTRVLFSILVDADRLNSEKWEREQTLGRSWQRTTVSLDAEKLLKRIEIARNELAIGSTDDDLARMRNDVFAACVDRGDKSAQGFFTLTVPTGGGKTLASMAFALSHARRHGLRRVIVVIPYLSIIEQNARVYRKVFGESHVLEHHSAVENGESPGATASDDLNDPQYASDAELAMENWDAPIIVTTSVQFIETLFAASTRRARKLHNIARSVVIFDEVQTLPTHLLDPTLDVLRELNERFGVSFMFCSATQPAFHRSPGLRNGFSLGELTEVAPDPKRAFELLQRVDYRIEPASDRWSWRRLSERMVGRRQALCVVNLRKHAYDAWHALRELLQEGGDDASVPSGLFHLSSAMCPAHRLDLLGLSRQPPVRNIKARLAAPASKPCWVISTQLIEAGVDIDFPVVFRAMGPLDSIVQAAGRCNREGKLKDGSGRLRRGEVIVFHPEDAGLPRGIYERATLISGDVNKYLNAERLSSDPAMFAEYFAELYQVCATDHSRKGEHTIQHDRAELKFRTVAERAKVINDDTVAVVVPYGRAKRLVRQIRKSQRFDRTTLRRLQRYMVNLRRGPNSDFAKLNEIGALRPLLPDRLEIPVLDEKCYDIHRGVVIAGRSPEDFII